jgi:hypothetical protein
MDIKGISLINLYLSHKYKIGFEFMATFFKSEYIINYFKPQLEYYLGCVWSYNFVDKIYDFKPNCKK